MKKYAWKKKSDSDSGTFCRYTVRVGALKKKQVVVRRGAEAGSSVYGVELSSRKIKTNRGEFELKLFQGQISPPPMIPGRQPSNVDPDFYTPQSEVLFVDGVEVCFPTTFGGHDGFTEEEIMQAIQTMPENV